MKKPNFQPRHLLILILLLGISLTARAAAGDLDTTFGSAGKVTVNVMANATGSGGFKAIVTTGGEIYQFGSTSDDPNTSRAAIVKLAGDGSLDARFGAGGKLVSAFSDFSFSRFYSGAVQPDGKILAVGSATKNGLNFALLARYLPGGQPDLSFNSTGYALLRSPNARQINFYWSAVANQSDGRIVAAGALDYQMAAARFDENGQLDAGFGSNGYRIVQVGLLGEIWDMKLTASEKIVMVGKSETSYTDGNYSDFTLVQLTAAGSVDTTFGKYGVRRFDLTPDTESDAEILQSVQILPDGKFLVFGRIGDQLIDGVVCRFNTRGTLDGAFGGGDGIQIVDYKGQNNVPQDMAVQADGKIVLTGTDGSNNFLVQRLLSDGATDTAFGSGGSMVTDMGGRDRPYSVSLYEDKILVAGFGVGSSGVREFAMARYYQNDPVAPGTETLSGRAVNLLGRGIAGAKISLVDETNHLLAATVADQSGKFHFTEVPLGRIYQLKMQADRCYSGSSPLTFHFLGATDAILRANCFRVIK